MTMYLLDTNTCIYIINRRPQSIVNKIALHSPGDIKISAVSVAEMEYGASKSRAREKNRNALKNFLSSFKIISFDARDAEIYGIIRAELDWRGESMDRYDMQLAAQALGRNYIFITNKTKEFERIKNLNLENWV
ncbi:twitching motility protein PilT [Spirochaetia bacterium]|nr:twitching motility protein PilT [Spirochaetia bacterium]